MDGGRRERLRRSHENRKDFSENNANATSIVEALTIMCPIGTQQKRHPPPTQHREKRSDGKEHVARSKTQKVSAVLSNCNSTNIGEHPPLNIAKLNVRELEDKRKQSQVLRLFLEPGAHVLADQETRISSVSETETIV